MVDLVKSLELLFDRPNEPLFTPKGEEKVIFQLPDEILPPAYANTPELVNAVESRFGEDESPRIPIPNLKKVPKFTLANQLPFDADLSLFLPLHQQMVSEVVNVIMDVAENDIDQVLSTSAFCRTNLNPQLFNYCLSVALTHRPDTRNVPIKNYAELFPFKFVQSKAFAQARALTSVIPSKTKRDPIIIPVNFTASDLEEEQRVAYFREDIGVNLHHWHWHRVYPFGISNNQIVAKDRRGELFFYMHQQIIARYNCERLSNSLQRVKRFNNWREAIPEGYFPKLDSMTSSRSYCPRQRDMTWQDLNRPVDGLNVTISQMEQWRSNVREAIASGFVITTNGERKPLDIDMLGNMMEPSILSPNPELYGNLHNNGHIFAAYMHDPQHRYLENFGVMGDVAIAMRDPFFYRWHAWVDDIFQEHKQSNHVPKYTRSSFINPGVQVTSATIESSTGDTNMLNTFWMASDVNLSRGLDFADNGDVYARFTHLNHRPFRYVINVNNTDSERRSTVRIFIGPKNDERNMRWIPNDQRKLMIEMDKFVVQLKVGQNTIIRESVDSSVTIPFEQTFRDLNAKGNTDQATFNYCGCGWPQHMLVPKGTEVGAPYTLFVMLSNYDLDKVEQPESNPNSCKEAFSYCGLLDKLYPDRRAMGYPFDRPLEDGRGIEDFNLSNIVLQDITIRLQNVVEPNPLNLV